MSPFDMLMYVCVVIFGALGVIAILDLLGIVKIERLKSKKLFNVILIGISTGVITGFTQYMKSPHDVGQVVKSGRDIEVHRQVAKSFDSDQTNELVTNRIQVKGVSFTSKWWRGFSSAGDKHCGKGPEWEQFLWNGTSKISLCTKRTNASSFVVAMKVLLGEKYRSAKGECRAELGNSWTDYMWDGINRVQLCVKWASKQEIEKGARHYTSFTSAWKKACPTGYVNLAVIKPDLRICGKAET